MLRLTSRALASLTVGAFLMSSIALQPAVAGTTGGITGRVVDSSTQAPIAGVTVTAVAASQSATSTTDASGSFRFLSLAPDTYTLQFTGAGYEQLSQAGITIFADQVQTLTVSLVKSLKTIARVTSRSAGDLVKAGSGSDVYSVNSAVASASAGLTGPGSLSNAYGAIASVPGVAIDPGESGWFQTVHIRGGDIDQVGYELDGIPVNRVYDNAPMTMLSSLGQQELQVYTGGTPASADAQGISGYINQVVKTGTYPGFGTLNGSIGSPAFYHAGSIEAGGSNPARTFSYYVGLGGSNQDYRYVDNNQGASQSNWFFYPVNLIDPVSFGPNPSGGNPYVGTNGGNSAQLFGPGNLYGIANTMQRDSLVNFHFAIPHKSNGLRDDLQLLYLTSEVFASYFSSTNDVGYAAANSGPLNYGQYFWDDSYVYNGPLLQAPNPNNVIPYYFPNHVHTYGDVLPANLRDTNDNGVSLTKFQYQHAFSENAFIRAYGYVLYSNWYIDGPNTAAQPYYGAELAQYQIPDHTFGGNVSFTDQLGDKHLFTASYGYTGSNLQRYSIGYIRPHYSVASFLNNGSCYDPLTTVAGAPAVGCVWFERNALDANFHPEGDIQNVLNGTLPTASPACLASPACAAAANNPLITNDNFYSGSGAALNQVHTRFSGISIGDQWRPNDRWNINLGLRVENFRYIFAPTGANDPARQFWFNQYNNEYCIGNLGTSPVSRANSATGVLGSCPSGTTLLANSPLALSNPGNVPDYVVARFEPRFSFTYTANPNTVFRASAGIYARPPNSSWVQYNVVQQDLPVYLGSHFLAYGFNTPEHYIKPDTSYNYDFSWEQRLKGTDISFKLTPFYRATRDQLQNFFIDPAGGLESGVNVGNQVSEGVEFALSKGDFTKNGWAGQLAYTYTHSRIKYKNFNGLNYNVIDQLNGYIQQYNSFTSACAANEAQKLCGSGQYAANGQATFQTSGGATVTNPYYASAPQGLLDPGAQYTTYDVIPGPFAGLNGYAVPHVFSLLLNYKHDKLTITPGIQYASGADYGAPTSVPGYDPSTCGGTLTSNPTLADPASCLGQIFIPDPYNGGHFDTLGQFKQPWTLTGGLGISYEFSQRIKGQLSFTNLINVCHQRGYAWDNSHICTYGALGASLMAPAGNFYPNNNLATPPVQMQYPYGYFINNTNTGFVGTTEPVQITGSITIKL